MISNFVDIQVILADNRIKSNHHSPFITYEVINNINYNNYDDSAIDTLRLNFIATYLVVTMTNYLIRCMNDVQMYN